MTQKRLLPRSLRLAALCMLLILTSFAARSELSATFHKVKGRVLLKTASIQSAKLSAFNGKPTAIKVAILLPENLTALHGKKIPVMYHFPGFGAELRDNWQTADALATIGKEDASLSMAHVFVDPSIDGGYSYFTDSQNNGLWESALITEVIPALEHEFKKSFIPGKRFLTGHSSGGWTALWLQISNPNFFDGVWATSPDPADFSNFFGIDLRPESLENFYIDPQGKPRAAGRSAVSGFTLLKDYVAADEADTDSRGDMASYEWAFSDKEADGKPSSLFDRKSGALNAKTLKQWETYDLKKAVEHALPTFRAALEGKIHIVVGEKDDYFLDQPTKLFCNSLIAQKLESSCIFVPDRTHRNLYYPDPVNYPEGLLKHILMEAAGVSPSKR